MERNYAEVLVDLPSFSTQKIFYYSIPESFKNKISFGSYVTVPFGKRKLKGFVVGFKEEVEIKEIREILELIEENLFSEEIFELAKWVSSYYFSPINEVLHCIIPPVLKKKDFSEEVKKIENKEVNLNDTQIFIFENIIKEIEKNSKKIFLLHFKERKEIYLKLIEYIKSGVIFLVPEIYLIEKWEKILRENFGNIGVLHSELSKSERLREWAKIKRGDTKIVLGTRLAIFAPLFPKLIIVEEEENPSYKQIHTPRYNARDVAIKRAKQEKAILIMGTSAASLEAYHMQEKILFTLREKRKQQIKIVNMKKEREAGNKGIISNFMAEEIKKNFIEGKKIFLFLNRRGYSRSVVCSECGEVIKCPNCLIPLSYHITQFFFMCHYCNFKKDALSTCPGCGGIFLKYRGTGIQKLEEEVKKIVNSGKIFRIDRDTLLKKNPDRTILEKADIILGTVAAVKFLPLEKISLVGIINPDISLNLIDFRSAEKTYQILTNLITKLEENTEVIIQTFSPSHYVIEAIKYNDYLIFYKKELKERERLNYPPFSHIVSITSSHPKEEKSRMICEKLKNIFSRFKNIEILGPAPSQIFCFKKKFRYQIILKVKNEEDVLKMLESILNNLKTSEIKNLTVDVDPLEIF